MGKNSKNSSLSRRDFMKLGAGAAALGAAAKVTVLEPAALWASARPVPPSDIIRFAIVGTGVRGAELLQATRRIAGVECVAAADLYDSRHIVAREALGGKDILTTRDYRQVFDRKDVDAVIIASTDHWHRKLVEDAAAAGKDIYCEKPLSHSVEDGFAMVAAAQKHKRMVTVGSQRVSSVLYAKAAEIYKSGKLGTVSTILGAWDRNGDSGAWVYPIPPNASEQTIDWNTFLGTKPKRAFDPVLFFRWRCYKDFGAGLAGDLFVHILSGIQRVTGVNAIPSRALSTGGLYYFKDGREFPDLLWTMYDYPDFQVVTRCNHNNDDVGEFFGFYGKEGTLEIRGNRLTFRPQETRPQPEGYSIWGWPAKMRSEYFAEWNKKHPQPDPLKWKTEAVEEVYTTPPGYNDTVDHLANWFDSIRTRKPVIEDEVFGNNTSVACHLANASYFAETVARWDAGSKAIKT